MPFPEFERCIYQNNPLASVICQLRFPPILRVETAQPAEFQDAVRTKNARNSYPLYASRRDGGVPAQIEPLLPPEFGQLISTVHDFSSADGKWTISLNKHFVALSTKDYWRWEEFEAELAVILPILQRIYAPAFFTRVGLRYQNVIRPSGIKQEPNSWAKLLNGHILGVLAGPALEIGQFRSVFTQAIIELKDVQGAQVLLQHGLAEFEGEQCYVIDTDFNTDEQTEVKDAISKLRVFQEKAGKLFQWCITERLHYAMEPIPLTDDRAKRSECA